VGGEIVFDVVKHVGRAPVEIVDRDVRAIDLACTTGPVHPDFRW
jgi:hypothetical protein